ncbi:MAG: transposase, partial [Lachnospiraceae bacterium]|nr:transposase [Lachnospiraceae bacterium]
YGMHTMLTTDEGHCYGEAFGEYQIAYADWLRIQSRSYYKNKSSNPGRKKYNAKKRCLEEQLHSYMNQELNRFLKTEKPKTIYLVKLPETSKKSGNKRINYVVNLWQRGYIRKRLTQKCEEQSIEIIEVFGKDISNECSCCGRVGKKADGEFFCPLCGYCEEEKRNTARNIKKRGQGEGFYKDHKSGLLDESRR